MASELVQPSIEEPVNWLNALTEDEIEQCLQEAEDRLRRHADLLATTNASLLERRKPIPKLQHGLDVSKLVKEEKGVVTANPDLSITPEQRRLAKELRPVDKASDSNKANDITHAGPQWFNVPKTEITPQLKRDLQIIEMRSVLDPHRHYKKNTRKDKVPVFSQVGTIIEGPTEFFSGRINRKDRSKNFVEEAMKIEADNGRFKRKYAEIQEKKTSGKKGHYKKLMAKRKKS